MRREEGVIGALNEIITRIAKARERGEDIGMAEYNKIERENILAAARHHRLYHYLGPRDGDEMPESALTWFGDPAISHEPGTEPTDIGFHPTCSCGFRALLTSATQEGALRRARVHAQVSTAQPESRYVLSAYDGDACEDYEPHVRLYCREHGERALVRVRGDLDEHREEIAAAVRDHDRECHGATL